MVITLVLYFEGLSDRSHSVLFFKEMTNIFDVVDVLETTGEMATNGGNPKVGGVLMTPSATGPIKRDDPLGVVDKLVSGAIAGIVGTTVYGKQFLTNTQTLP